MSLTRHQKTSIILLQLGTFLEYFDLMLFLHMGIILNETFFPHTDKHTANLLSASAFCSIYILRPFGALIFGYIGDSIGRQKVIVLTTLLMAVSCIVMANLPTYAQIGIAASWIVTLCRMMQGLLSMGEIIGAQVYVTEITQPPSQYFATSLITVASSLGSVASLGIAFLVINFNFNWRLAFWIGAFIALVGSIARLKLSESPIYLLAKQKRTQSLLSRDSQILGEKTPKLTCLALFLIHCGWPLSFYLVFIYFNSLLTHSFGYTSQDVIIHNFFLSIEFSLVLVMWSFLSYKMNPLKIIKIRAIANISFFLFLPWFINQCHSSLQLFLLQSIIIFLSLASTPAEAILIKALPILKRFTLSGLTYAFSRTLMNIVTAFGLVYLTKWFNHWGILLISFPISFFYLGGVRYFEKHTQHPILRT